MSLLEGDVQLDTLLRAARTVAVVGASDKPHRDSYAITRYLMRAGYEVFPVNPEIDSLFGRTCYPDLKSLPKQVDIVNVFRRPEHLQEIVDDALASKAKALWLQFGTTDDAAAKRASEAGLDVVIERCIMVEHGRLLR